MNLTPVETVLAAPTETIHLQCAKIDVLRALRDYQKRSGLPMSRAEASFTAEYNAGLIDIEASARELLPQLVAATLKGWRLAFQRGGPGALINQRSGPKRAEHPLDAEDLLCTSVRAWLKQHGHASTALMYRWLIARFRSEPSVTVPPLRTLQRWIRSWKREHRELLTFHANPDRHTSLYRPAHGTTSGDIVRLNQEWEVDCSPADLLLSDGRYTLSAGIDVYSRRVRYLVTKTARGLANGELLRRMIMDLGVPEAVRSDQGKDYLSNYYRGALANLGIVHRISQAFTPQQKPHIERSFRTLQHDFIELLPGYVGHNVAQGQDQRSRHSFADRISGAVRDEECWTLRLTAADLQEKLDRWCVADYEHRAHEGLAGKSPFEIASAWNEPVRRIADERQLDLLLAELPGGAGIRRVRKKGIQLERGWFCAPELEGCVGQFVQCRYLPEAGKIVVYSHGEETTRFICIAVQPQLAIGISHQELARAAMQRHKRRRADWNAQFRRERQQVQLEHAADEILRQRDFDSGKIALFPRPIEPHATPALTAAAAAVNELNPPARTSADLIDHDTFQRYRAEALQAEAVETPSFATPMARVMWLSEQHFQRALSPEEQDYVDSWRREHPRQATTVDELIEERCGSSAAAST